MAMRRTSRSLLAGATSAALLTCWLAPAATRAAPTFGALSFAPAGKASVLTLEGDDPARAAALSKALQTEFAARGVGGGREMSLAELKLTMGCDEPPSAACLGSGGKTLGVDRMVYGALTKNKSGSYTLNLSLMEVGSATIEQTVNAELAPGQLTDGTVQATAKELVVKMLGPEEVAPPPVAPPATEPDEPAPQDTKRKWVWGRYDAPKWKKAGLAASAALTVASLGVAIGTYILIRPKGKYYNDLVDAANASLDDSSQSNNVNPNTSDDLCELARAEPPGGDPGEVTNASMTQICNKADTVAKVATAGFVATGVFAASTLVFATLLFVHKDNRAVARLQRRGVSFGVAPARGGAMIGGGMRF
jgi:hypothetical protein